MKVSLIFVLCPILTFFSCGSSKDQSKDDISEEMKICHNFLKSALRKKELNDFRTTPEDELVKYHRGLGMYVRNNLLRHHKHSEEIKAYFKDQGIIHLDDVSSLILRSFHRSLNNKGADVSDRVKEYQAYWQSITDCKERVQERAMEINKQYEVGDTLRIQMPVGESNSVIDYPCPDENREWQFNDSTDLEITGVITKKYHVNSPSNVFFTLQVLTKSKPEVEIMMEGTKVGDELRFSLKTAWKVFPVE
ncbi:MAG: hypothetical protein HWE22_16575 [Flavobacteriales bacterium]|nr:hypothetical protein [Flavobacteriales bacterium]